MEYKFIKEGKAKFTTIVNAIKSMLDYDSAVDEADGTGKPYFISAVIDGKEIRTIAWNNAETKSLEKGSWEHKVCKTLADLREFASDDEIFGWAYAQYRIKGDAEAVHPKTGRVSGNKNTSLVKAMVEIYNKLIPALGKEKAFEYILEISAGHKLTKEVCAVIDPETIVA